MTITSSIAAHDSCLVPDEGRWGQGYGGRPYTLAELDAIAANVAPARSGANSPRLTSDDFGLRWACEATVDVPAGFDVADHPNRSGVDADLLDPRIPTSAHGHPVAPPCLQAWFRGRGWRLDQHGRPLHPHAEQLLADPRIGLPTGLGFAYRLGETVVADAVAIAGAHVLLTTRETPHEGLVPAVPGGYSIPADEARTTRQWRDGDRPVTIAGIIATARRKLDEETGLRVPAQTRAEIVRAIRPVSSVHTLHAWTVVYTVRFELPARANLTVRSGSCAQWWPLAMLGSMWPDHRQAVVAALA